MQQPCRSTVRLAQGHPPFLLKYRSSNFLILLVVCTAVFTDIFLYGLLVPVLPFALTERIGVPQSQIAKWNGILLALYNLGLCVGSPIVGFYADRMSSRKLPFLLGLIALAGSTLLLCLSKSTALFAVGRTLQGVSAAICWAVGLALLADSMKESIGRAMGWVNWAMTAAFLAAPLAGGVAYEKAGYYSVYYMAFGLILCDIILRFILIERRVSRKWQDFDMETVPSECRDSGLSPQRSEAAGYAPSAGIVLRGTEQTETPTIDGTKGAAASYFSLIKSRRILASLLGCTMQSASKFALYTTVPSFVERTFVWGSLATGLVFLCVCLPGLLSPAVGSLADRHGTKWLSCAGFIMSVPLFICLRFVTENTTSQKALFGSLLALLGVAVTLSGTPLMAEITYVIEEKERRQPGIWGDKGVYGVGYGLFTTSFALGGVIGSFMAGYLYQGPGWNTLGWAFAIWCAGGAMVCGLFVGKPVKVAMDWKGRLSSAARPLK